MLRLLGCVLFAVYIVESRKIVDLTHTFDQDNPKYPLKNIIGNEAYQSMEYYRMTNLYSDFFKGKTWVAIRSVEYFEHQGTHIDAPEHYGKGRATLEAIPPERLVGPGVVIDVKDKVNDNPDYAVTVADIEEHENKYGRIPPHAIVSMNSGWALKFPNAELVFGSKNLTEPGTFHFPGWSPEACIMLLRDRQVNVVGVDTPSTDPAQPTVVPCHIYLQNNDIPLLEYIANLDAIPPRGTTIVLGVPKFRNGTGGPTRILALLEDEDGAQSSSDRAILLNAISVFMFCLLVILL